MQIGQFFGEVDPVLMINLVNTSLYSFNKTYDYQSVCDPEKDSKAAAGPRSVYVVRYSLINHAVVTFSWKMLIEIENNYMILDLFF